MFAYAYNHRTTEGENSVSKIIKISLQTRYILTHLFRLSQHGQYVN